MNAIAKTFKYVAIGKVTIRNHLAYMADFAIRTVFLGLILYIFIQLWDATFRGEGSGTIAGYTLEQIIWYLIFAESITMACPSLATRIEEEVKNGDVAYKLTRPVSYVAFHFVGYLGEVAVRLMVNMTVGSLIGIAAFGWPDFGFGWIGFAVMAVGAFTVNFMLNMMIALCAFWVEETRGIEFVYHKLLFTIGGMLLPLELFPKALQAVCAWLPFQSVLYFTAKTAVRFDWPTMARFLLIQWGWAILLAAAVFAMYAKGVKKLNVNGG